MAMLMMTTMTMNTNYRQNQNVLSYYIVLSECPRNLVCGLTSYKWALLFLFRFIAELFNAKKKRCNAE